MAEQLLGVEISGDAGVTTAAAVVAVIAQLLHNEAVQRSIAPRRPRPSAWVTASGPRDMPLPLPSDSFGSVKWHERSGEAAAAPKKS